MHKTYSKRSIRQLGMLTLALCLALPALANAAIQINVSLDNSTYAAGDTLKVTATARDREGRLLSSARIAKVTITDANDLQVVEADLVEAGSGLFTYQYTLSNQVSVGTWKAAVYMKERNQSGTASQSFPVVEASSVTPGEEDDDDHSPTDPNTVDNDLDGYTVNGGDCNDANADIFPGAVEICGDGIDQDCSGADLACTPTTEPPTTEPPTTGNHYGSDCVSCHGGEALDVHASLHYQWQGEAPDMVNQPGTQQGKLTNSVNSYCINILGNWTACGTCHVGKGAQPEADASTTQLANIDCLKCHSEGGVLPTRTDCLECHAKAGGGDAVKRGDLALATGATTDSNYDVHMATTGGNLQCQDCHVTQNHRIAGKGSDLRATDLDVNFMIDCSDCHSSSPHDNSTIDQHTARVACQTCHIPTYAKNASDTAATEATETSRTWLSTESTAVPYHPASTKANNLTPRYRFWNGQSDNYLLGDEAVLNPATGNYPTSLPVGSVQDKVNNRTNKLYPFKYKTAQQPMTTSSPNSPPNILIALDTSVFFAGADADAATAKGLENMGMSGGTWKWVQTETFQSLNHQVSPKEQALQCTSCHGSTSRMDLQGELGYQLKASQSVTCTQCHGREDTPSFDSVHSIHVTSRRYDCSWCHTFSRPERGLRTP